MAEKKKCQVVEMKNCKAYHDYFVGETIQCGIALWGNEIKSIRKYGANFKDAWVQVQNGNLVIRGMHITKWDTSNVFDVDENRERQLLAHKSEIAKLQSKLSEDGCTLIPVKLYFVNGRCKILVGVCKGKHNYDKRESLKTKQVTRDINRALKEHNRREDA